MSGETFESFVADCKKLCKASKVPVVNGTGDKGTRPAFGPDRVAFNGVEDDSHETFWVQPGAKDFDFCKTARKPYDLCVTACLIALKRHSPSSVVSSDGGSEDWQAARDLCEKVLGYGADFSLPND
jgi:hypothetical protein